MSKPSDARLELWEALCTCGRAKKFSPDVRMCRCDAPDKAGLDCKRCNRGVFLIREATSGPHKGEYFWGCSNYSSLGCKNTIPYGPPHDRAASINLGEIREQEEVEKNEMKHVIDEHEKEWLDYCQCDGAKRLNSLRCFLKKSGGCGFLPICRCGGNLFLKERKPFGSQGSSRYWKCSRCKYIGSYKPHFHGDEENEVPVKSKRQMASSETDTTPFKRVRIDDHPHEIADTNSEAVDVFLEIEKFAPERRSSELLMYHDKTEHDSVEFCPGDDLDDEPNDDVGGHEKKTVSTPDRSSKRPVSSHVTPTGSAAPSSPTLTCLPFLAPLTPEQKARVTASKNAALEKKKAAAAVTPMTEDRKRQPPSTSEQKNNHEIESVNKEQKIGIDSIDNLRNACLVPENEPLYQAFVELAEFYRIEGNHHAHNTYTKVANAICNLDREISDDNAMTLYKGDGKVKHIGKATAEKMFEFLVTGTMTKLEEKRKAHGFEGHD